jgi:DNA-binding PadR family transcriptional regulator
MSIRQGLLTLLDRGPLHGYELRRQFELATGNTWPLNVGQVYTTLSRLERDGMIAAATSADGGADGEDSHRVFAITRAGRAEVREWFTTPVRPDAPPRDELAIKLALAAQTADVDLSAVIQIQRTATMLALQSFTRAREQAGAELSWQLVADSLIFSAEAELRWLDHCEVRLARAGTRAQAAGGAAPPQHARPEASTPGRSGAGATSTPAATTRTAR